MHVSMSGRQSPGPCPFSEEALMKRQNKGCRSFVGVLKQSDLCEMGGRRVV